MALYGFRGLEHVGFILEVQPGFPSLEKRGQGRFKGPQLPQSRRNNLSKFSLPLLCQRREPNLFLPTQRDHSPLPVLILTAHGRIPDAVSATRRGVFGYLTKPYESAVLLEQVEAALRLSGNQTAHGEDGEWRSEIITRSRAMED